MTDDAVAICIRELDRQLIRGEITPTEYGELMYQLISEERK